MTTATVTGVLPFLNSNTLVPSTGHRRSLPNDTLSCFPHTDDERDRGFNARALDTQQPLARLGVFGYVVGQANTTALGLAFTRRHLLPPETGLSRFSGKGGPRPKGRPCPCRILNGSGFIQIHPLQSRLCCKALSCPDQPPVLLPLLPWPQAPWLSQGTFLTGSRASPGPKSPQHAPLTHTPTNTEYRPPRTDRR